MKKFLTLLLFIVVFYQERVYFQQKYFLIVNILLK